MADPTPRTADPKGLVNVYIPRLDAYRSMPADEAEEAARYGLVHIESQEETDTRHKRAGYAERPGAAGLYGALRGASFGASDLALTGLGIERPEDLKGLAAENPRTTMASGIAGGVASALIPGAPAALLARGAHAAGHAASRLAPGVALSRVLEKGAATVLEGSAWGVGHALSDVAQNPTEASAGRFLKNVGLNIAAGGAVTLGTMALGAGARGLLRAGETAKEAVGEAVKRETKRALGAPAKALEALDDETRALYGELKTAREAVYAARGVRSDVAKFVGDKGAATPAQVAYIRAAQLHPDLKPDLARRIEKALGDGTAWPEEAAVTSTMRALKHAEKRSAAKPDFSLKSADGYSEAREVESALSRLGSYVNRSDADSKLVEEIRASFSNRERLASGLKSLDDRVSEATGYAKLRQSALDEYNALRGAAQSKAPVAAADLDAAQQRVKEIAARVFAKTGRQPPKNLDDALARDAKLVSDEAKRLGAQREALEAVGDTAGAKALEPQLAQASSSAATVAADLVNNLSERAIYLAVGGALGGGWAGPIAAAIGPQLVKRVSSAIRGQGSKAKRGVVETASQTAHHSIVDAAHHAAEAGVEAAVTSSDFGSILQAAKVPAGVPLVGGAGVPPALAELIGPFADRAVRPLSLSALREASLMAAKMDPDATRMRLALAAPPGTPPAVVDAAATAAVRTADVLAAHAEKKGPSAARQLRRVGEAISSPADTVERLAQGRADPVGAAVVESLYPQLIEQARRIARAEKTFAEASGSPLSREGKRRFAVLTGDIKSAPQLYQTQTIRMLQGLYDAEQTQSSESLSSRRPPRVADSHRGRASRVAEY